MQKHLMLRKTGVLSLSLTIPADFIRERGLQAGDTASWSVEGNIATLEFFRVTTNKSRALQEEAVDAA